MLALPFALALGALFWLVGDGGESGDEAAGRAAQEPTVSTRSEDPDGAAPEPDSVTPTTATEGVAAGDAVGPVDEEGRTVDPPGTGTPGTSGTGTAGTSGAPGSSGSAGSPGSTAPPGGGGSNKPGWSTSTTTPRSATSTTAPRPSSTTTTTAPPGLLDGLLDLLGLG